jgi:hypothetical protein
MQVFSQAFEAFIREFKVYEPLLTDIKREYELLIENQMQELNAFEITKSKLSVMEYQKAKEIQTVMANNKKLLNEIL